MIPQFFSDSWSTVSTKISNGYAMTTSGISDAYSVTTGAISDSWSSASTKISNGYAMTTSGISSAYSATTGTISNQTAQFYETAKKLATCGGTIAASGLLAGLETWALGYGTPDFLLTTARCVVLIGGASALITLSHSLGETDNGGGPKHSYPVALEVAASKGPILYALATTECQKAQEWIAQKKEQQAESSNSIEGSRPPKTATETVKEFAQQSFHASLVALRGSTRLFEPLGANQTAVMFGIGTGLTTLVLSGFVYPLSPETCAQIAAVSGPILGYLYENQTRIVQEELALQQKSQGSEEPNLSLPVAGPSDSPSPSSEEKRENLKQDALEVQDLEEANLGSFLQEEKVELPKGALEESNVITPKESDSQSVKKKDEEQKTEVSGQQPRLRLFFNSQDLQTKTKKPE